MTNYHRKPLGKRRLDRALLQPQQDPYSLQVRTEKDKVFVKVGDRESEYHVVGLESVSK
jgi:hypothetical protein